MDRNYISIVKAVWKKYCSSILEPNDYCLMMRLIAISNDDMGWGDCFMRNNYELTGYLKISYRQLTNSRNKLQQVGLISFDQRNGSANCKYQINYEALLNLCEKSEGYVKVVSRLGKGQGIDNTKLNEIETKLNLLLEKEAKENFAKPEIVQVEIPPQTPAETLDTGEPPNVTAKGKNPQKEKSSGKKEKVEIDFTFCENSPLKPILIRWMDYKKWKGQRYKGQDSVETMFRKLCNYSGNDPTIATEIIEDAIARNYSGFFQPKNTNSTNGNQQTTNATTGNPEPKTIGGMRAAPLTEFVRRQLQRSAATSGEQESGSAQTDNDSL